MNQTEKDAPFTAIISDLHLCEAQGPDPRSPLWKKYKTKEFFFDNEFKQFLDYVEKEAKGRRIELVLNGDVFDFDSVMAFPEHAPYKISWLERARGLHPQEPKSSFKIRKILEDHKLWVQALREFLMKGNKAVFVIGNHDLELHFPQVQKDIIEALDLPADCGGEVTFCSWFYISNKDTLIEHGNQYDPYCLCQDPINPLVKKFNRVEVRIPFGNIACRYMINGMGFFNPHVDSNYIMTVKEYINFFFKYMAKAQPFLLITWFWGAVMTLLHSFVDILLPSMKDPLTIEDRIETIAKNSNATPRMVREMKELTLHPAAFNPLLLARELWLDQAFLVLLVFFVIFQIFTYIKLAFSISFFWMFIPLALFIPFFIFYAKSFKSNVHKFKEPDERILSMTSRIARVKRIIYGHTHVYRHEHIGNIEHLNSGAWSPMFLDVECTKPFGKKTFILIKPTGSGKDRTASLHEFKDGSSQPLFGRQRNEERLMEEARNAAEAETLNSAQKLPQS